MAVDKLDHHGEDDPQSFGPECILLLIVFQQLQKSFFRRVHRPVKWERGIFLSHVYLAWLQIQIKTMTSLHKCVGR